MHVYRTDHTTKTGLVVTKLSQAKAGDSIVFYDTDDLLYLAGVEERLAVRGLTVNLHKTDPMEEGGYMAGVITKKGGVCIG